MFNPYVAKSKTHQFVSASTHEPISQMRRAGSSEQIVGGNGELNAGSKKELAQQIAKLIEASVSGQIVRQQTPDQKKRMEVKAQVLQEALADRNGPGWQVLGEVIGDVSNNFVAVE